MKRLLLLLSILLLNLLSNINLEAQGSGTPSNLIVRVDANGYLVVAGAVQTNPITQGVFSSRILKTDASGNLLVVQASGSSGFSASTCAAPANYLTGATTTGIAFTAAPSILNCIAGVAVTTLTGSSFTSTVPILLPDGTAGASSLGFASQPTLGLYKPSDNAIAVLVPGYAPTDPLAAFTGAGFILGSAGSIGWSSTIGATGTVDVSLSRDAANILSQRKGTAAQTFRIYNTFTDAANYERLGAFWLGNIFYIQTEAAGGGAARALSLGAGGAQWQITTPGHWTALVDNLYDIGAIGAMRPKDYWGAGNITVGGNITLGLSGKLSFSSSRSFFSSPIDGVVTVANSAGTGFTRFIFGTNDTTVNGFSFEKDSGGHYNFARGDGSNGTLTVANIGANSCGTTAATIAGNDHVFVITVGATSGTACRVTFISTWAIAPICVANNETTAANLANANNSTTTTVDVSGTFVAGDKLGVLCGTY